MAEREKVSEWWEIWIDIPNHPAGIVRRYSYGHPIDFRIPREGFPSREEALKEKKSAGKYARLVHVTRYRKTRQQ